MFGSLAVWRELCTYASFDRCESLKTNMVAFRWCVFSVQRLHEDSDIFLFWLDLDFFEDLKHCCFFALFLFAIFASLAISVSNSVCMTKK